MKKLENDPFCHTESYYPILLRNPSKLSHKYLFTKLNYGE